LLRPLIIDKTTKKEKVGFVHVWNKIMRPEEHADYYRKGIRPVTRGDPGNRLHTTAFRMFHIDEKGTWGSL